MERIRPVYDALQQACPKAVWSRGVALTRSAEIVQESDDGDEIVLTVKSPVAVLGRTVRVFVDDEDWLCDCSPAEDICDHVVAAIVKLKRAREAGEDLGAAERVAGRVVYHFERNRGGLALRRAVRVGHEEHPFTGSVAQAALARGEGPTVLATPLDLEVEGVLGYRFPGWIPGPQMVKLLRLLVSRPEMTLDGEPIKTSFEGVGLIVRLTDHDRGGFLLQVVQDPAISEVFNNQVVRCGGLLRPLREAGLTARELAELRGGTVYRGGDVPGLVSEILPDLRARAKVEVLSKRLPKPTSERPRLVLRADREGHELVLLATIVYGDPAIARLAGGKLVPLGKGLVPIRDPGEEERLSRRAARSLDLPVGHVTRLSGEDAVTFASRIERWPGTVEGDGLRGFHLAPPLVPLVEAGPRFQVRFESDGHGQAAAGDVMAAFRAGASLVPVDGGGWAPLPTDWLTRYGQTVSDLLAAREPGGGLAPAALIDLARLCRELEQPEPPSFQKLRALVLGGIRPAELPGDLRAELRTYQRAGIDWLAFLREAGLGAMLCDDMGLGKTLQALCAVRGRTLVVAPTSVLHGWAQELRRFRPSVSFSRYHGPDRTLDPGADVTITSYAILRLDIERLAAQDWDTVVLDEAQAIKNPDSKVARAAFRLHAGWKLTLTGTPVENRLDELWSQMHFANPGLLGGREDFRARYARPIAAGEPGVAAHLRARLSPLLLRRLKRDVAPELPPRTDLVLHCRLTDPERSAYDAVRLATRDDVVDRLAAGGSVLRALEALLRLRQAACHRGLLPGGQAETSSKIELLLDRLDTAASEGHKALVFSQWTSLLDRVEPHLDEAGLDFVRLDGSTRDRAGVVDRFQSADGPPIMLISLKAGGTGLNLTAADHVFLLDPWWNPAVEDQAADRAHRIGQEKPVFVYRLVARDTVEERILGLQEAKRALADAALGEADRAAGLTREDLLALLD